MPNFLSKAWGAANEPLVPEEPVRQLQESMTTPRLDESPTWAKVKGFGAGALEGLRGQTSPVNIASNLAMLLPGAGIIGKGAAGAQAMGETAQVAGGATRGGGAMAGLMDAAPQALAHAPEFAPVGGEAAWNAARPAVQKAADPLENVYQKIMSTMGRRGGDATNQVMQDINHPGAQEMIEKLHREANPVFKKMQAEGAFSGQR